MRLARTQNAVAILVCAVVLASCKAAPTAKTAAGYTAMELTPYYTATNIPTKTATPVNAPTATPAPTLTPTPRTYSLDANDTMWVIAARNGLTVSELMAANPSVDPLNLKAGMKIIIPAAGNATQTQTAPTPTAVSVVLGMPECTPSLTGGDYCFVMVENQQNFDIQNLAVQFVLTDPASGNRFIQEGLLPLNRLAKGTSLPLFTFFAPPVPANPIIEVQLLSASPISKDSRAFIDVQIASQNVSISSDGYSASVDGSVRLLDGTFTASQVWLAAVAYDADGKVVAVRQLNKQVALSGSATEDFSLYVYSIAGKIDHVAIYGEANP